MSVAAAVPGALGSLRRRFTDGLDPVIVPAMAVSLVVALGFGLVVPVLPLYARSFGVGAFEVGMLVSAFAAMRLVSDLPAGLLIRRIGSARAVALGTSIVACSSAAAGFAANFLQLLTFRGLGGIGSAMFSTGMMSYMLTVIPRDRMGRNLGAYQSTFLLGNMIGPTVGDWPRACLGCADRSSSTRSSCSWRRWWRC
jgi:MFS family permease